MNRLATLFMALAGLSSLTASAQTDLSGADKQLLDSLLSHTPGLSEVWKKTDSCRLQIIYTRVIHKKNGKVAFENHTYNLKDDLYFYPASMVKLPVSLFTIEKVEKLKRHGVSLDSRLSVEGNFSCQTALSTDKLSDNGKPTLRNYIQKALIVSNNEAFNRLYEFVGPEYIHKRLAELGYPRDRIITRFAACDSIENRHTNGFRFYNNRKHQTWQQPPAYFDKPLPPPLPDMKVGIALAREKDTLPVPKDFSSMNCFLLKDMHSFLERLIYPTTVKAAYHISAKNRAFLLQCLSAKPRECSIRKIACDSLYFDACTNYLYYGAARDAVQNPSLKIFNIVGQSYGFLSDVAYFRDSENKVEFFLSAVIYTNSSGIMNTGVYEYKTLGFPFLRDLGQTIYSCELGHRK